MRASDSTMVRVDPQGGEVTDYELPPGSLPPSDSVFDGQSIWTTGFQVPDSGGPAEDGVFRLTP